MDKKIIAVMIVALIAITFYSYQNMTGKVSLYEDMTELGKIVDLERGKGYRAGYNLFLVNKTSEGIIYEDIGCWDSIEEACLNYFSETTNIHESADYQDSEEVGNREYFTFYVCDASASTYEKRGYINYCYKK